MAKEYIERVVLPEDEYYSMRTIIDTIMEYVGEQTVSKYPSSAECKSARMGAEGVIYALEKVPATDVVEIVRCKECKNSPNKGTSTRGMRWCRRFRNEIHPNDFCSYGERRTEND